MEIDSETSLNAILIRSNQRFFLFHFLPFKIIALPVSFFLKTPVYDLFASFISRVPVFLLRKKSIEEKIQKQLAMFQAQDLIDKRVISVSIHSSKHSISL